MNTSDKLLSKKDIFDIKELAKEKRRYFDVGMLPIGDNIFKLIRKEGIKIIYSPVKIEPSKDNYFSAIYVKLPKNFDSMKFIGLNTADYFDRQIFALAHELYHNYEESTLHMSRIKGQDNDVREQKANRFAAEFLLPTEKLESEVLEANNGDNNLKNWASSALLRLIAKLHCEYKLPYHAIIRRLKEINSIDNKQFSLLYDLEHRNPESDYYHIGLSTNKEIFNMLNTRNYQSGVDADELNTILNNYDDDIISSSDLAKTLSLFNKTLADFGLEAKVDDTDLKEIKDLF